jgi:hypothetical protein
MSKLSAFDSYVLQGVEILLVDLKNARSDVAGRPLFE